MNNTLWEISVYIFFKKMLINLLRDLLFKNIVNVFHVVFECENTFDIVSSGL